MGRLRGSGANAPCDHGGTATGRIDRLRSNYVAGKRRMPIGGPMQFTLQHRETGVNPY